MLLNSPLPGIVRRVLHAQRLCNLLQCVMLPANQHVPLTLVVPFALGEIMHRFRNLIDVVTVDIGVEWHIERLGQRLDGQVGAGLFVICTASCVIFQR